MLELDGKPPNVFEIVLREQSVTLYDIPIHVET